MKFMQGSAPVKYIIGILTSDISLRDHVIHILSDKLGEADYLSEWLPFNSHIYSLEMGDNLQRSFVSFKDLQPPEHLAKIKTLTLSVEDKFLENNKRRVNIDPGYIDHFKVVLASGKFSAHKIAIDKGCYADMQMYYEKGKFLPLPWCHQDFVKGNYDKDFLEIRRLFKVNLYLA